jgi:hypothetical protein
VTQHEEEIDKRQGQNRPDADAASAFLWDVHRYTNEYIRFADTKAAFIATACTALIGSLVASSMFESCCRSSFNGMTDIQWFAALALVLLSFAVLIAVWSIRPRLPGRNPSGGFIFWESVTAHSSAASFTKAFARLSEADRTKALAEHVFVLASIAKRKYTLVGWAVWLGLPGGLIAPVVVLLKHALR